MEKLFDLEIMSSSTKVDNNSKLKTKLESQLTRLLDQLQDLEDNKNDLDEEEYLEMKADTMEQGV